MNAIDQSLSDALVHALAKLPHCPDAIAAKLRQAGLRGLPLHPRFCPASVWIARCLPGCRSRFVHLALDEATVRQDVSCVAQRVMASCPTTPALRAFLVRYDSLLYPALIER